MIMINSGLSSCYKFQGLNNGLWQFPLIQSPNNIVTNTQFANRGGPALAAIREHEQVL